MPFINVKLTEKLTPADKDAVKAELGRLITVFPGKSESWLMCDIEDAQDMYFQGRGGSCAFAEVKLFGGVSAPSSDKFTAGLCELMKKYGIPSDRVYVRYAGGENWGWNGSNF